MISTKQFATKTIFCNKLNPQVEGKWIVGLDVGYSGVKMFSNNFVGCFPSYARKRMGESISFGANDEELILYRNAKGEEWVVGEVAQATMTSDETNDSTESLYGRHRWKNPMSKILAEVGLALSMRKNEYGDPEGQELIVQTGLPPAYLEETEIDADELREALAGEHVFSMKVGNGSWEYFNFSLPEKRILIMAQPMGAFFSILTDEKGRFVKEMKDYCNSNLLIFDPGFGTFDVFNMSKKEITSQKTIDELGMKRVLEETLKDFMEDHKGVATKVPTMQTALKKGVIRCGTRKERNIEDVAFDHYLKNASKRVCLEALNKVNELYNDLFDHDYLVLSGGTSSAWEPIIREYYGDMKTLTIVKGCLDMPNIFTNVRGYFMYCYGSCKAKKVNAA